MLRINFIAVLVAAFVPMVMGFIWYNPKVMGTAWAREAGMTEEKMKSANMPLVFGLSFVFAFMLSFVIQFSVIHQFHLGSMLQHHQKELEDTSSGLGAIYHNLMLQYGSEFRTFKHGMLHGFITALFMILPVIATNAMFERKSWRYIWINFGYWSITFMVMGGIVCAWQ
jgi:hypothetical protein